MALQNRVTPFGNIIADKSRGAFTGNRGVLHDPVTKKLRPSRLWITKAWIYCRCDYKGHKRDVFGANGPNGSAGWTNLFFLDEATALAAGHRPCFYCQRARAMAFQAAFSKGQGVEKLSAPQIDTILHAERLQGRTKRLHEVLEDLPDGAMVTDGADALLCVKGRFYRWSSGGYEPAKGSGGLMLLTPPSTVAALRVGYKPLLLKMPATK